VRNVAVLMPPTVRPFELAVYCEVFGVDRTGRGVPPHFGIDLCLHERPDEGLSATCSAGRSDPAGYRQDRL